MAIRYLSPSVKLTCQRVSLSSVLKSKQFREEPDHLKPLRQAYAYVHAGKADSYSSSLAGKSDCWRMLSRQQLSDLYAHPAEDISPFTDKGSYSTSTYHA